MHNLWLGLCGDRERSANNGSVYLYATSVLSRTEGDSRIFPAKYHLVKMITPPSNDRVGVTCLSICPQQKRLVVGTMRGVVYAIQLTDYHKIGEKVEFSHDFHAGFPITCFLWDKRGNRLFSACNAGLVCQTVLRAGMSAIFGSTDTELLLKEETGIVQVKQATAVLNIARYDGSYILMVSSQLRVLLLNLTSGDGSAVQIGTKARQGAYGACFFTSLNVDSIDPAKKRETKVFSSRPGRRVWVANPQSGTVSSTLKFSLAKNPTAFLQSPECAMEEGEECTFVLNLTINKLGRFQFVQEPPYAPQDVKDASTLLVSWNVGSSVLFFLDPFAVEIVEWHLDLGIIHDLKIVNETTLVVLHGEVPKVSLIQSCSAEQFLQIYGADDVKKSVEVIEFNLNDSSVLNALQTQWEANLEKDTAKSGEYGELTAALKVLADKAKEVEDEYLAAAEVNFSDSAGGSSRPLQVIFKQRPQQVMAAAATAAANSSDMFANRGESADTEVTLATGSTLHKPIEYFDVLAPSDQSYSKSISAPDGSTMEARLMDIPELPRANLVLADDFRESYMDEIMEEVKRVEQSRTEGGAMNMNLLPALKGGSTAAAKAFSTFIPSSNMLTHLMDGSIITDPFGRSDASGIFSSFPEYDEDELVIDPDPRLFDRKYTYGQRFTTDAGSGCSVLRIAMSTIGEADESNLDTEVLLEAISMDIWDSNLKYTSNLPLNEQLNLPDGGMRDSQDNKSVHNQWNAQVPQTVATESKVVSQTAKPAVARNLELQVAPQTAVSPVQASTPSAKIRQRLVHRASMSPDAGRAAQRAIQRYLGATPNCEIKARCMVGGRIAISPELEPILRREVSELASELQSAAMTAEKTKELTRKLWPASGITRVCACLTSLLLFEGDLCQVQTTIGAWLSCFDPTAQHDDPAGSDDPNENENDLNKTAAAAGFARGEALVDGDGLPLTRGDWNLVRTLVSIYFAICAAGSKLHLHPLDLKANGSGDRDRLYEHEMGITMKLEPRYRWDCEDADAESVSSASHSLDNPPIWTASETEAFVTKYGVYLNPDLAAEVCNLRRFTGALKIVLDEVVSSADMSEMCDDIVGWISSKECDKAFSALEERDSLCLLLHLLDILLKKCPQEAIEVCVRKYPVLYPWNIERNLFGAELEWATSEDADFTHEVLQANTVAQTAKYFRYLVRLLEDKGDQAGKDAQIVARCLDLCFVGGKVVEGIFDQESRCGLVAWVAALVRQPQRFVYDHSRCWQLFEKHYAFPALLELALLSLQDEDATVVERGLKELYKLVALVMERKELRIFDALFERVAALPVNSEECLGKILGQIQTCVSIDNRNEHLSSAVIHALLNAVNLSYGMQLLARFPLLFAATPLSTYHTIVETHVLTERQKHEVMQTLEIVDTNLWASYKEDVSATSAVSFAPQLTAVLKLEMGASRPAMDLEQYEMWEAKCKQYDAEMASRRLITTNGCKSVTDTAKVSMTAAPVACRSFEYRNSDWGGEVQLHDSTCGTCELPVVIIGDGTFGRSA
ncbi:hypothetical protein BBJ28_00011913 [Nothophytophthora sp. Chile5]|nr:hypothetical protein BBJ28_00011913 [Nothophytophthora sp. Chile5]